MSIESQDDSVQPSVLEFKSCSLTIPVLVLRSNDQELIASQLEQKIAEAPAFFKDSPVIFDLNAIRLQKLEVDLAGLTKIARSQKLIPIGIRGGSEQQKSAAVNIHLAAFSDFGFNIAAAKKQQTKTINIEPKEEPVKPTIIETKIISRPVRSGQRVYANGDLIITSQVSAGSEIMAEGNIHVYGTLRGRALAGVKGNTNCRIFCKELQAELVSIAGIYKTCEELVVPSGNPPIQIALQDQTLSISAL